MDEDDFYRPFDEDLLPDIWIYSAAAIEAPLLLDDLAWLLGDI